MAIRLMNDVGAPAAVTGIDLIVETTAPQWNEWAAYGTAGIGYLSAMMGWGGEFLKNMGIAAFPWAAKKLYDRVRGGTVTGQRLGYRPARSVSRYPAPLKEPEFRGTRLSGARLI